MKIANFFFICKLQLFCCIKIKISLLYSRFWNGIPYFRGPWYRNYFNYFVCCNIAKKACSFPYTLCSRPSPCDTSWWSIRVRHRRHCVEICPHSCSQCVSRDCRSRRRNRSSWTVWFWAVSRLWAEIDPRAWVRCISQCKSVCRSHRNIASLFRKSRDHRGMCICPVYRFLFVRI